MYVQILLILLLSLVSAESFLESSVLQILLSFMLSTLLAQNYLFFAFEMVGNIS